MKNCLVYFLLLAVSISAYGFAPPEKIVPITKVAYPLEYYLQQAGLWEQETRKSPENPDAWLNYFRAARYANMLSDSLSRPYDLEMITGNMPVALAGTFEFNYILFMQQDHQPDRFDHLLKAHELAPERMEAYLDLVMYYVTTFDSEQEKYYCEKLFDAGEFSPALLAWNFNALNSVEENGILLTHGDNDTYPAWVVQNVKNERKDVLVLNVNLLMNSAYREKVFRLLGLPDLDTSGQHTYKDLYLSIARHIFRHAKRPAYVATSVPGFLREAMGDSLYLVGLAFKYDSQPFDNVATLNDNYEHKFLKDHLRIDLEPDTGSNVLARMNLHYLPALITLHRHFTDNGQSNQAAELEPLMRRIAMKAGKGDEVAVYLNAQTAVGKEFVSLISVKKLEQDMVPIRKNLYASATEVTNEQYEAFLTDLLKNRQYDMLDICKVPAVDWRQWLPESMRQLDDKDVFPFAHPDDPGAPVQHVSFEAARLYCDWITRVYNQSNAKHKKFSKVRFRLPTEEEWEYAAHGGKTAPYPWGGIYIRNSKGCFLLNLDAHQEKPCQDCGKNGGMASNDGGFFPVQADAYFPNDFGLYNCSGNVAEMISVEGIAKGGSWEDNPDACKIESRKQYSAPGPAIGFRVFMEVSGQ